MSKVETVEFEPVTIETIDRAIKDWFDRTVDAHVESHSGERTKVPVVFAAGERFASSRTRRAIRDANGILILPIMSLRRTGIEPIATMSALGTESPSLSIARRIDPKTSTLANAEHARPPSQMTVPAPVVYEVTTIPFPDRSIMTYDLEVQAQYIGQMNAILEKVFHVLDIQKSFVAPVSNDARHNEDGTEFEDRAPLAGHYVVGFFESTVASADNFEEFTDTERIVKYRTSFRVPAVLQLDPDGSKPSVRIQRTALGLSFRDERVCFVDDPAELELVFGRRR